MSNYSYPKCQKKKKSFEISILTGFETEYFSLKNLNLIMDDFWPF